MARETKKELAYDYLKRKILEKQVLPGQRITASQVAEEIGVSVLPVREALLRLEAEKLITITPYVGAVVAWVSADEVIEVISILAVLEGYATAQAKPRIADHVPTLLSNMERLTIAVEKEMWSWFVELNREFHFTIFNACSSEQLVENLQVFWSQLDTMLNATSFHLVPHRATDDIDDHRRILELLRDDDADPLSIELAARQHRMRTAAYLLQQKPEA